jgi:8-oxo-dGTP pyrophosphatase MutT (NUDIX family)
MSTAPRTEIIARAAIRRDAHLLQARERGREWSFLPGGHVEPGEPIEAALAREIAEELGTEASVGAPLGVVEHGYHHDGAAHHELNLVFDVAITDPDPTSREEHLEFHWQPLDTLPTVDVRPRALRDALAAGPTHTPFWRGWTR